MGQIREWKKELAMEVINGLEFEKIQSSVAIGKFDGIHKGHRTLIQNITKKKQWVPTVVTFQMRKFNSVIYTQEEKDAVLEELGVKREIVLTFDEALKNMTPEAFISEILVDKLQAKYICVGEDFCFGKNREGTIETLRMYQDVYGYELETVAKLKYDEEVISSTRIRKLLLEGDVIQANELLEDAYFIEGKVIHGNALGRTIQFPTANMVLHARKEILPFGVYATTVEWCGKQYYGVTNIGQKPTVGKNNTGIETHIIDFDMPIYEQNIKVRFYKFLRKECKFETIEQLRNQIETDRNVALAYLQKRVNIDSNHAISYNY